MWTDDDQAKALAWMIEQHERCRCGHLLPETTRPDRTFRYVTESVGTCDACASRERFAQQFGRDGMPAGMVTRTYLADW